MRKHIFSKHIEIFFAQEPGLVCIAKSTASGVQPNVTKNNSTTRHRAVQAQKYHFYKP